MRFTSSGMDIVIIRYYLSTPQAELRHLQSSFAWWVSKTLADQKQGISSLTDVEYHQTKDKNKADIVARLVPQSYINKRCGFSELSCSLVSKDKTRPDEILFSLENWMGGSNYDGNLGDYRRYLVNHEFLHCRPFYLEHPHAQKMASYCLPRQKRERPLPVMYQQSRGPSEQTKGCHNNSWPLRQELNARLKQSNK